VAAFQDAHVSDRTQQSSKFIALLQTNIDDLKTRLSATQTAVAKANALIKQNPSVSYTPLSLRDSEAPDFLDKMGETKTYYQGALGQYTTLKASFDQLTTASTCVTH